MGEPEMLIGLMPHENRRFQRLLNLTLSEITEDDRQWIYEAIDRHLQALTERVASLPNQ